MSAPPHDPPPDDPFAESERDQVESGFTPLMRRVFRRSRDVLCVVFLDHEGECIDYCSVLDPFDAKVTGAHMSMVLRELREPMKRMMGGEILDFFVTGATRDIIVRRLADEYFVILAVRGGTTDEALLDDIEVMVKQMRAELAEDPPYWDLRAATLRVPIRDAVGWAFAPDRIIHCGTVESVDAVLGRWEERGGLVGGRLICFRVRTGGGERTLAFDPVQQRWFGWS